MSLRLAIECASSGRPVEAGMLEGAFDEIMAGEASDAAIAGLLIALRTKGETVAEITAAARALRRKAQTAELWDPNCVDTCGTGGDGASTFNISTVAAFVVAGAGVPVAKHGNRAASSRSGSFDVLEALGVKADLPIEVAARVAREVGIGFFFARRAHPAMAHVAPVRAALGVRTIMNCLGPLLNPVGVRRQLVGVYGVEWVEPIARVLAELGSLRAWVVHGDDGLDEITTTTTTAAALLDDGKVTRHTLAPEDFGVERASPDALAGGSPEENAEIARSVLAGDRGPRRDLVIVNAAAALHCGGAVDDLREGAERAAGAIDTGAAEAKLEALIRATEAAA